MYRQQLSQGDRIAPVRPDALARLFRNQGGRAYHAVKSSLDEFPVNGRMLASVALPAAFLVLSLNAVLLVQAF
jgi:hypothetical protein